jgi:hypothetical protein
VLCRKKNKVDDGYLLNWEPCRSWQGFFIKDPMFNGIHF